MNVAYAGPVLGQSLAVELHNTIYAAGGEPRDGIADLAGLRSWLVAVYDAPRAADAGHDDRARAAFVALRGAVRATLQATLAGAPVPPGARRALNEASAAGPLAAQLASDGTRVTCQYARDPATIVLAAVAADTIELVAGPRAARLRACGAPSCVLVFLKDHPRRRWCSDGCGNRARQARHYARRHG